MRLSLFLVALTLSACGGLGANTENDLAPVCAEQAAMAEQGRTDGRSITITCP